MKTKHRYLKYKKFTKKSVYITGIAVIGILFSMKATNYPVQAVDNSDEENVSKIETTDPQVDNSKSILYSGNYGKEGALDSKWYISDDKVLHLEKGTVLSQENKSTSPWAKYSDYIDKISLDGEVVLPRHIEYLFADLTNVKEFDNLSNLNAKDASYWTGTFKNDSSLEALPLPIWDGDITRGFLSFKDMFKNDSSLKSINISGWDVDNVMTMENMFANDTSLTNVGVEFFVQTPYMNIASLANVKNMFKNDSSLEGLDLSNWKMFTKGKLMDTSTMFSGTNLKYIKLSNLNQFTSGTSLPSVNADKWVSVGSGSLQDPEANKSFSSSNIAELYNGNGIIEYPYSDKEKDKFAIDTFVPNPLRVGNVIIKSNLGDQTVKDVSGNIGDKLDVKVPIKKGYKADRETVSALVNDDGSITTSDFVTYTSIKDNNTSQTTVPSHNSSSNVHNQEKMNYRMINEKKYISTFSDRPDAKLYSWNKGSKMKLILNRALHKNSDWISDKQIIINNKRYYRVSTNGWVKSEDVYEYRNHFCEIRTKSKNYKTLITAEGNSIRNRALMQDTNWRSDRLINVGGEDFYRVATNEFVAGSKVYEY